MSNNEVKMNPKKMIISKTDPQGNILYVNAEFTRISGFERVELLGKPHNIIRHKDMPRGVFKLFWDSLQSGNEFNGYVKNRCENGDYYWVFATVNPWVAEDGKTLKGYFSARRAPNENALDGIKEIYQKMLAIEVKESGKGGADSSASYLTNYCEERGLSYDQMVIQLQAK